MTEAHCDVTNLIFQSPVLVGWDEKIYISGCPWWFEGNREQASYFLQMLLTCFVDCCV